MKFAFTDEHIEDYWRLGYAIFRQILPSSLLTDMRHTAEHARRICLETNGPQAQRLQPIGAYPEIGLQSFRDFGDLPPLRDAINRTLSADHSYGSLDPKQNFPIGILFEPLEQPLCTTWHRDWRDNLAGNDVEAWLATRDHIAFWNQYNCALYDDSSTWIVPGSHRRDDLPAEIERFPERPVPGPILDGQGSAERERACLVYAQSMPGAFNVHLYAGDFLLYRNAFWHLGNYSPHRKRATLHEVVATPLWLEWMSDEAKKASDHMQAGHGWRNPNAR